MPATPDLMPGPLCMVCGGRGIIREAPSCDPIPVIGPRTALGAPDPVPRTLPIAELAWFATAAFIRLTVGRAKLRDGGTAAVRPAFAPSMALLVGLASMVCTGLTLLIALGDRRKALRATG